jgi:hypothetical protein
MLNCTFPWFPTSSKLAKLQLYHLRWAYPEAHPF